MHKVYIIANDYDDIIFMSRSLHLFWLAIIILSMAPAVSEEVGYVFGESGGYPLANSTISKFNGSEVVTFTTAGTGEPCPVNEPVDKLQDTFNQRVESKPVHSKAVDLVQNSPGPYAISQICDIYTNLAENWNYVPDPRCEEYFQYANETLSHGRQSGRAGAGDCDDFAILMAAMVESIEGTTRVILAKRPGAAHAYAEVYLGNMLKDNKVEQIIGYLKLKYNKREINTHADLETGDVWLNLDCGEDINKADYPGCALFSAEKHIPLYIKSNASKTVPHPSPIALFSYYPTSEPNAGEPIIFDGSESGKVADINEYSWELGDGTATTTKNASINHIYSNGGTVIVNLTVKDKWRVNRSSKVISINNPPVANFTYSPSQPQEGDVVSFDAFGSKDDDGRIVNYKWDFGDKQNAEEDINPAHIYKGTGNFSVNLTVIDDNGAKNSISHLIKVNKAPAANFTYRLERSGAKMPNPGESITFDASQSKDPDGQIVNYSWNFRDGKTDNGALVIHDFTQGGNYTVQLRVRDNNNATSTQLLNIIVNKEPIAIIRCSTNTPEAASKELPQILQTTMNLLYMPDNLEENKVVTFNASESNDPDGSIKDYRWEFGDGSVAAGIAADHIYLRTGVFNIKLTVTDNQGATNSSIAKVMVKERNREPVVTGLTPIESNSGIFLTYTWRDNAGIPITWIASASDQDGDQIYYRFLLKSPFYRYGSDNEGFVDMTGWITENEWTWKTSQADIGNNQVEVQVRDNKHCGPESYDDRRIADFTVMAAQNRTSIAQDSISVDYLPPLSSENEGIFNISSSTGMSMSPLGPKGTLI